MEEYKEIETHNDLYSVTVVVGPGNTATSTCAIDLESNYNFIPNPPPTKKERIKNFLIVLSAFIIAGVLLGIIFHTLIYIVWTVYKWI